MNDKQKQFIKECIILSSISIYFFQLVLGSILFENINIWIMINMSIIFVLIVMIVYSLYNVIYDEYKRLGRDNKVRGKNETHRR